MNIQMDKFYTKMYRKELDIGSYLDVDKRMH